MLDRRPVIHDSRLRNAICRADGSLAARLVEIATTASDGDHTQVHNLVMELCVGYADQTEDSPPLADLWAVAWRSANAVALNMAFSGR